MSNIKTIKELCEFIWYLEDKYDLLDFEIDNIKVWQYSRMAIYYGLAKKLNILTEPHQTFSKVDKIKSLFRYIFNSIFYNPFFSKKVATIVFSHPRLKKVDDKFIDIYTHYFKEELDKKEYIEISYPYSGKHLKHSNNEYFGDIFIVGRNLTKFIKISDYSSYSGLFHQIDSEIDSVLGIDFKVKQFLINKIKKYKIEYSLYTKLFQKLEPKSIYLTVSYGKGSLIKAAKDLNITVNEFQHGTYSKYHLGYSFPNRTQELEYFPDKFFVWNDFWRELIKLPIKNTNIINYGFNYMDKLKLNYKKININKNKNQIVILSQGAITDKVAQETLSNIEVFGTYNIKYKLHPGEYQKWKNNPIFKELLNYKNIEIIEDCDLYNLFASSKYVIGVFSTAIYEALEFDCKVFLYNLTGIEYMEDVLDLGKAHMFEKKYFEIQPISSCSRDKDD